MQMNHRRKAARYGEQVAGERLRGTLHRTAVVRHHAHRVQPPGAGCVDHDGAGLHFDALRAHRVPRSAGAARAGVDHRRHVDAGRTQVQRGPIRGIVVGEHDRAASAAHAIGVQVGRHRLGQHHAGPVVVAEHERALVRTGGQHDLARVHLPQAFARTAAPAHREMIGQALRHRQLVVVVVAEHGAARQQRDPGRARQLCHRARQPLPRRHAVDRLHARSMQAAAQAGPLVGQHHAPTAPRRRKCRRQPRRPASDHQHVAVGVKPLVNVGIGCRRGAAQTRSAPDPPLVHRPPAARPHERLVVEAGRHQAREQARQRHPVALGSGKAVHAGRGEICVQLDFGRPCVRNRTRTLLQLYQRVGLLDAGRHDAARTVVFPAATDQVHAVGQQGRSQRIASHAPQRPAIEAERERLGRLDQGAAGGAKRLAHCGSVEAGSAHRYTRRIR